MWEYALGVLTALFHKKVMAIIEGLLGAIWLWCRATPRMRLKAVSVAWCDSLNKINKDIDRGRYSKRQLELLRRLIMWEKEQLDRWHARVMSRPARQ
jgi:hypothetical protein